MTRRAATSAAHRAAVRRAAVPSLRRHLSRRCCHRACARSTDNSSTQRAARLSQRHSTPAEQHTVGGARGRVRAHGLGGRIHAESSMPAASHRRGARRAQGGQDKRDASCWTSVKCT